MDHSMVKCVFSIVSHDQSKLVATLVSSIDKFVKADTVDLKIILTENVCSDISITSSRFKTEKIINLRPKGFGANHNSAFEKNDSDYFFIINPDIIFLDSFDLDIVIDFLKSEAFSISSPEILGPTGILEDYKRADLSLKNLFRRRVLRKPDLNFEWFAGMFLIVNSESFRSLSGFDTKYFMYCEDTDLCMRARQTGQSIGDLKGYSVMHDAQRSSSKDFKYMKWHIVSLLRYLSRKRMYKN